MRETKHDSGIELGCGRNRDSRCVAHIDANPNVFTAHEILKGTGFVHDVSKPFPARWHGSSSLLVAHDILEHISYWDTESTLRNWRQLLVPGGMLDLMVPDAGMVIHQHARNEPVDRPRPLAQLPGMATVAWKLLGGLDDGRITKEGDDPDLNLHRALFDRELLTFHLHHAGFVVRHMETNPHPNLIVWAEAV